MSAHSHGGAPTEPVPEVPSWRLVLTLALAGAIAGLLIVMVHGWAQPRIQAHQAQALAAAVHEVLGAPERTERLFVVDGALVERLPAGMDSMRLERVFLGYDAAGAPIGFAVQGAEAGFQDVIRLIFGYDPATDRLLGMLVLDHKETPGLGDRIVNDSAFVGAFRGARAPLAGVKSGAGSGDDREVDMITGATISSRAVIDIINGRIEALGPVLKAHLKGGSP